MHRACQELEDTCHRVPRTPFRASRHHSDHHVARILSTRMVISLNNARGVPSVFCRSVGGQETLLKSDLLPWSLYIPLESKLPSRAWGSFRTGFVAKLH